MAKIVGLQLAASDVNAMMQLSKLQICSRLNDEHQRR